ncbi:ATP-binding protein [Roseibium sp. AS2]|uniref:ATP-binding protein n=1 Tax=Roseibium sp. AS2 TaxID=3135781 RepID=UPI0031801D45
MNTEITHEETPAAEAPVHQKSARHRRKRNSEVAVLQAQLKHTYYPHVRDQTLLDHLNKLLDDFEDYEDIAEKLGLSRVGRLNEGRAVVVVGESGTGKTRSLERAFADLGMTDRNDKTFVLSVWAPSPCNLKQLGVEILETMGYKLQRDLRENVVWRLVREQLALRKIRFLHIDELQHLTQLNNPAEALKVSDTLKGLMQNADWPVWLILSGMPKLAHFIESDFQLRRRSTFVRLDLLTACKADLKEIRNVLHNCSRKAKLSLDDLPLREIASRLLHGTEGRLGYLIEVVQEALSLTLQEGRKNPLLGDFERAYEVKTGCHPKQNVFADSIEWQAVDVRNTLFPENKIDEEPKPKKRRRKVARGA